MAKYIVSSRHVRVAGVDMLESPPPRQKVVVPAPLAEWAFEQTSAPFLSTAGDLGLIQSNANLVTRGTSPWGYAAQMPSSDGCLYVPAASVGRLNIGAGSGLVTVAAWVYVADADTGFVAGCWQEAGGDPRRSYGLFFDLGMYGGNEKTCMHVSKTGAATPGYPYSKDYAASLENITRNSWQFLAGTYDGSQAIAYMNGRGSSVRNYKEPGAPNGYGLIYDKNPYLFDLGLNATPCDFTVGAVRLTGGLGNSMKSGLVAKLRVWDQVLTPQEIQALYNAEVALVP